VRESEAGEEVRRRVTSREVGREHRGWETREVVMARKQFGIKAGEKG